jgi:hypothetical protein
MCLIVSLLTPSYIQNRSYEFGILLKERALLILNIGKLLKAKGMWLLKNVLSIRFKTIFVINYILNGERKWLNKQ